MCEQVGVVTIVDLLKLPSLWFCLGAEGTGEGCGGNEEEQDLRHLKC